VSPFILKLSIIKLLRNQRVKVLIPLQGVRFSQSTPEGDFTVLKSTNAGRWVPSHMFVNTQNYSSKVPFLWTLMENRCVGGSWLSKFITLLSRSRTYRTINEDYICYPRIHIAAFGLVIRRNVVR